MAGGVLEASVAALCEAARCRPADIDAWLGACIGPRRFEVDLAGGILDLLDDRLDLEQFDLAGLGVELRLDVDVGAVGLLGGRLHRLFDRLDDERAIDAFLFADLVDDPEEF